MLKCIIFLLGKALQANFKKAVFKYYIFNNKIRSFNYKYIYKIATSLKRAEKKL